MSVQIDKIKAEMIETQRTRAPQIKTGFFSLLILFFIGVALLFFKQFVFGGVLVGLPLGVFILCLTGTNQYNGLRILQPEDRAMVESLGKPYCIKGSGLTVIIPWLMNVRAIVPTWKEGIKLFSEREYPNGVHIDLKNGGKVQPIDPILWTRLHQDRNDPGVEKESVLRAVYGVDDYIEANQEVTEDALKTCLNNLTVEEVLSVTHDVTRRSWWDVVSERFSGLEGVIESHGFEVKGLTISDFNWDEDVVKTRQKVFQEERSIALAEYSLKAARKEITQKALEWGGVFGEMVRLLMLKKCGEHTKAEAREEAGKIIRHFKSAEAGTQVDAYINGGAGNDSNIAATLIALARGITLGGNSNSRSGSSRSQEE